MIVNVVETEEAGARSGSLQELIRFTALCDFVRTRLLFNETIAPVAVVIDPVFALQFLDVI
jgi:hypothetical protein